MRTKNTNLPVHPGKGRKIMGYPELLKLRDEIIKVRILSSIPPGNKTAFEQAERMLDEAFAKGAEDWEDKYLPVILGEGTAKQVLNRLDSMEEIAK